MSSSKDVIIVENSYKSFGDIKRMLRKYSFNDVKKDDVSFADRKAITIYPHQNKKLYDILNNAVVLRGYEICKKIPCEYRKYDGNSFGMKWHVDDEMMKKSYYEAILTVHNTSANRFEYVLNNKTYSIKPKPNMLILIKPKNIWHRSSPLHYGSRRFLKFILEKKT